MTVKNFSPKALRDRGVSILGAEEYSLQTLRQAVERFVGLMPSAYGTTNLPGTAQLSSNS